MSRNDQNLVLNIRTRQGRRTSSATRGAATMAFALRDSGLYQKVSVSVNETRADPLINIALTLVKDGQAHLTDAVPHGMHVEQLKLSGHFNRSATTFHIHKITLGGYRADTDEKAKQGVNRKMKLRYGRPVLYGGQVCLLPKQDRRCSTELHIDFNIAMNGQRSAIRLTEELANRNLMRGYQPEIIEDSTYQPPSPRRLAKRERPSYVLATDRRQPRQQARF